jgi:hypothetical protein
MEATARAVPLRTPERSTAPWSLPSARGLLRLVPQRRSQAAKTPFVVVLVVLLVGGLLGLLLLNTMVAQDSFTLHDLASQSRDLQLREQQLASEVEAVQAPSRLAARATQLGMVPGGAPAFLRLADGRVLGTPSKGRAAVAQVASRPTASTAAASSSTTPSTTGATRAHPSGSTTWTSPRQTPPPTSTGAHR